MHRNRFLNHLFNIPVQETLKLNNQLKMVKGTLSYASPLGLQ